jgi:signal transduction histidine kinase
VWQVARLEAPIKRATLLVYGRLLATLGNTFLRTRYHTLLEAHRLDVLEQRVQERTAALHREMAEHQRLEREAQRAEHFTLLGRLAAGVSHEIRNPLGAVFLHVDLLEEELRQPSPDSPAAVAEALVEIKLQLLRLEDLVQNYLSLVRVGNIQREVQDLGAAMVAWAAEAQGPAVAGGVTVHLEGLADLGLVAVHTATLRRAVLNLVQNALVGLYIVQEIVTAHAGQLTVQSAEGHGTTFTITLPRSADEPSGTDGIETEAAPDTGEVRE